MLKTYCSGCIWRTKPEGCKLDKPVFLEDVDGVDFQFTHGFCRHKRGPNWARKNANESTTHKELLGLIDWEENILACIILFRSMEGFERTLESILEHKMYISQVIVSINDADSDTLKAIMYKLEDSKLQWTIDSINEKEDIDDLMLVNYASRVVKPNWFMVAVSGDLISENAINTIASMMDLKQANFVGFYFHDEDNIRIVTNKFVFRQLAGNVEKPWLEKVKGHENWENVCLQLTN